MQTFLITLGSAILGVGIIWQFIMAHQRYENNRKYKKLTVAIATLFMPIGLIVLILGLATTVILTGKTGVITRLGQIQDRTLSPGIHMIMPIVNKVDSMDNRIQTVSPEQTVSAEAEGQINVYYSNITVEYRLQPGAASVWVKANIGDSGAMITMSNIQSAIREVSILLPDTQATNRAIVEPLAREALQRRVDNAYAPEIIVITNLLIGSADFDSVYNDAILARQTAETERQRVETENKTKVSRAEADADALLTRVTAEADALKIAAEGQRDAYAKMRITETDDILYKLFLEEWDGRLPAVMGDVSSGGILIDPRTIIEDIP